MSFSFTHFESVEPTVQPTSSREAGVETKPRRRDKDILTGISEDSDTHFQSTRTRTGHYHILCACVCVCVRVCVCVCVTQRRKFKHISTAMHWPLRSYIYMYTAQHLLACTLGGFIHNI